MTYAQIMAGVAAVLVAFSANMASAAPANESSNKQAPSAKAQQTQTGGQQAEQQKEIQSDNSAQNGAARRYSYEPQPSNQNYRSFRGSRSWSESPRFLHADRKVRGEY